MRRWDKDFEKAHNRKPTEADHEASDEFQRLQEQLRGSASASGFSSNAAQEPGPRAALDAGGADAAAAASRTSEQALEVPDAAWWRGNDYHELLRARVQSQAAVNGFEGVSASDVHATAAMFSHWDLDRDGVLGAEEFALVINSLAQHAGRSVDADTVQRLLALVDRDGNGKVDFNEFLAIAARLHSTSPEGSSATGSHTTHAASL
mmetsp:Transcript_1283/g.3615  ORF Transcript_1283/g.3615 Transcript_1283/m.3615 type:complete len:206 (-) Transcript_1283:223-840(-)